MKALFCVNKNYFFQVKWYIKNIVLSDEYARPTGIFKDKKTQEIADVSLSADKT